jgi:hypothetical protein
MKTELHGRSQVTHYSLTDNRFIRAFMYMEEEELNFNPPPHTHFFVVKNC